MQKPLESKRMSSYDLNPMQRGTFTLSKCLEYTNQISNNLKYDIRARFEQTDSQFYDLDQQQLSIYFLEMIAPVTMAKFLKTLTFTGHPHNYVPIEQKLQTFL